MLVFGFTLEDILGAGTCSKDNPEIKILAQTDKYLTEREGIPTLFLIKPLKMAVDSPDIELFFEAPDPSPRLHSIWNTPNSSPTEYIQYVRRLEDQISDEIHSRVASRLTQILDRCAF